MPILPGRRLGPYEILTAIGAGGMGEVYKARDTRLDRIVAIKVLPTHLTDRVDLGERFEREARTIASLNHPHICTLYDIGHQDGIDYLVLEYLEGETLAQRLVKGPLPLDQVLQYAIEVADALDKAHGKGITHRDLKPGNIMLAKSGTKLLDFGLAKMRQETTPAPNISLSKLPTANNPATAAGTILGTLQYMAPEQLEGKEADARTDIFAFGVVVYEMVTGKKAFEGKSQASVIGAILKDDPPPISSLQPMTPPALDRVVRTCHAKDPEDRWQTARDLARELKWIAEGGSQAGAATPAIPTKNIRALGRRPLTLGLSALLFVAATASLATWSLKPAPASPPRQVQRFTITLPPGEQLALRDESNPVLALSPDGSHLAYSAIRGGTQQLYLRPLDTLDPRPLPGTEGAIDPFFSPDGQWLGFFAGGKLKKVSVNGGAAIILADAVTPRGASWSSEGKIVFAPTVRGVLQQVSDAGGAAQPVTRFEKGEFSHRWPEFLPDGKAMLFGSGGALLGSRQAVGVQSSTGERRTLAEGGTSPPSPQCATSGHLLYAQTGTLMAAPFDPKRLELTGKAVPVAENIIQSPLTGAAQYGVSETGTLAYIGGSVHAAQRNLVWVSRNGTEQALSAPPHAYLQPQLSPDGRRVAVSILEQELQTWLFDPSRDTLTRLSFGPTTNVAPAWTPDGKRVAFQTNQDGHIAIAWQRADGGGGFEPLTSNEDAFPGSFSGDGQLLALTELDPVTGFDIWVLRLSDRKAQPFLQTPFNESGPRFSPDGRWLAYISDESGRPEVYVQPYPGPGGKWQISTEGGTEPNWNRNGRELFFRSGDKMMVVEVTTKPGFSAGKPRMLFAGDYVPPPIGFASYDVSADGQRFLMMKESEEQTGPSQINVVLNWFEELKQKVPKGKK